MTVQCDVLDLTRACFWGLQDIGRGGWICISGWKVPWAVLWLCSS